MVWPQCTHDTLDFTYSWGQSVEPGATPRQPVQRQGAVRPNVLDTSSQSYAIRIRHRCAVPSSWVRCG
jgi:hypothetical protein